jgi:uncharacterized protein
MSTSSSSTSMSLERTPARRLNAIDWVALVLSIVGGVNWGLVGVANFDLVAALFGAGSTLSRLVYILVGLSALWLIVMSFRLGADRRS